MDIKKHTEERLEDAIVGGLVSGGGYVQTVAEEYDPERALNPDRVIQFIRETQPKPVKGSERFSRHFWLGGIG